MRNSKQETIADIVSEMLEFAETDSQTIGRDVLRRRIQNFARRFEAASKREVAELLECLEQAYGDKIGTYTMKGNEVERWRKALRENERLAYEREAKDGK